MTYDLAVVGAGILGLAHALAAARRGLKVVVLDRDRAAAGASVRNFGLVVVSGQEPGEARRRAERSREVWLEVGAAAGIEVLQRGMLIVAQRPEALGALERFKASPFGVACSLLTTREACARQPGLDMARIAGGLYSPHEIRVESRDAIPRLAAFLEDRHQVAFRRGVSVHAVAPPRVETSCGEVNAKKVVVCPGDDLETLYSDRLAKAHVQRCKLQMLRLAEPGFRVPSALVSDLSLLRYGGFSNFPETVALMERLRREHGDALKAGVHLIVVQSRDGSLVVGDSHDYSDAPDPFASEAVDRLILDEFSTLFGGAVPAVQARWIGTYASASDRAVFQDAPEKDVRLVTVTSGTGASTAFAIGEETIADLFGS